MTRLLKHVGFFVGYGLLGTVITVGWNIMGYELDAVYPALGASVLSLLVVSWLTPPPPEEKWKPFFE